MLSKRLTWIEIISGYSWLKQGGLPKRATWHAGKEFQPKNMTSINSHLRNARKRMLRSSTLSSVNFFSKLRILFERSTIDYAALNPTQYTHKSKSILALFFSTCTGLGIKYKPKATFWVNICQKGFNLKTTKHDISSPQNWKQIQADPFLANILPHLPGVARIIKIFRRFTPATYHQRKVQKSKEPMKEGGMILRIS